MLLRDLLDRLEREECRLLAWGVTDGGFLAEEIDELASAAIDAAGLATSPQEVRQALADRKLLFSFRQEGRETYRTRMAEAVRLFARLRQLFPSRKWQLAPTLVSDYRFDRRARRYPCRNLEPDEALRSVATEVRLAPQQRQALAALLRIGEAQPLRLSEFQLRATRRMLLDLDSRASRGLIVSAGTGTGKTLAFYLPALTHLATLVAGGAYWTKAIAIYPRNELLKDQFSETYLEARRLDGTLRHAAGRKLLLGAFFGPTPRTARDILGRFEPWGRERSGGFECPYLRCPRCGGTLLWARPDVERGVERLGCVRTGCGAVEPDEVVLTRERMAQSPPDVLFATTEMLNRQMTNQQFRHVFGVGDRVRRPKILLLDEVHTYEGTSGAQVALLLRRWHHAVGGRVHFTGLSATLPGAAEFFGQLVGLRPGSVEEVSPRAEDLDPAPEAAEYLLALRGDPASGTSLLSTSIQAAMLLRRFLDPRDGDPSGGLFGKRVFVFTDDLDVTNRLYNNLQDAEGLDSWGRVVPGQAPLAALRSFTAPEHSGRLRDGQSWQFCEEIGHPLGLGVPLRVSRTSSQDAGVDRASDVVVATAALEVGYNDPEVGAVLQHKAPRDWAAYLQRKGRAGRRRSMRPWTVVVLSDYGRDRLAFQAYEQLFDPELPHRTLPIANRYVLRMQAAFAFMDWVAARVPHDVPTGSVWTDFSGPVSGSAAWVTAIRRRQEWEGDLVRALLAGDEEQCRALESHLQAALAVSPEVVRSLLWETPRPLYTSVLPTLLRRLESGWRRVPAHAGETARDYQVNDHPLPDFVPQQLFGDLNLPEVEVVIPPQIKGQDPSTHFLALLQAMRTLAPGRVTRRFGVEHAFANHWVAPPSLVDPVQQLPVETLCAEFEEAGAFEVRDAGGVRAIRCVRPWRIEAAKPPGQVLTTSNAQLVWRSQIIPRGEDARLRFEPPRGWAWADFLQEVRFFTHSYHTHVEARRFAVGARAGLRFQNGTSLDAEIRYTERDGGGPAAVGFTQEVDGVVFRYRPPDDIGLSADHPNRAKVRSFRTAYFRQRVQTDPTLATMANGFQRDWLVQIYLSALTVQAVGGNVPLGEAHAALGRGDMAARFGHVLNVIFQSLTPDDDPAGRQRVHDTLLSLCHEPTVQGSLHGLAPLLWAAPDDRWHRWAAERFKSTLGCALLEACQQLCPDMDVADLLLDLDPGPRPAEVSPPEAGVEEIWITEAMLGGGGVVEEILRQFAADPRRFFRLAESALAPSDYELIDRELTCVLERSAADVDVASALAGVRGAEGNAPLQAAAARLRRLLSDRGLVVNHAVSAALHARLLRPGTSPTTDGLLRSLVRDWREQEERLGIEIDARVYAFLAAERPESATALASLGPVPHHDPYWRFQTLYGLFWPRGHLVRAQALASYNPYADAPAPDREILLDLLRAGEPSVRLEGDWQPRVHAALAEHGAVRLEASFDDRDRLKEALLHAAATAVEAGFLHLHPHLASLTLEPGGAEATLDIREVLP